MTMSPARIPSSTMCRDDAAGRSCRPPRRSIRDFDGVGMERRLDGRPAATRPRSGRTRSSGRARPGSAPLLVVPGGPDIPLPDRLLRCFWTELWSRSEVPADPRRTGNAVRLDVPLMNSKTTFVSWSGCRRPALHACHPPCSRALERRNKMIVVPGPRRDALPGDAPRKAGPRPAGR